MTNKDSIEEVKNNDNKNNSLRKHILLIVIILLLCISLGYSLVSSNILINGTTNIRRSEWNVHFDNVNVVTGNNLTVVPPTINNIGTIINFSINLDRANDLYELVAEVYNEGTIDAKVTSCIKLGLTQEQEQYVDYKITYLDNTPINEGDMLRAGEKKKIKVTVKYLQLLPINEDDLTDLYETVNLAFKVDYIQN